LKKIIILGANGMAGHLLTLYFRQKGYQVLSIARKNSSIHPDLLLDVTDFNKLTDVILSHKADFIINAVGILNEFAEKAVDNAILVNSYFPHFLSKITSNAKTKIIHISTDCVFSGKKGSYVESDPKDGIGNYAQTKSLGEINNSKDLTIRTSIIGPELNPDGIGLFNWFFKQTGVVKGYSNAFWSGVTTLELAKFIDFVVDGQELNGLIHLTNNVKISKFDLLLKLKYFFKKDDIIVEDYDKYEVDKSLLCTRKDIIYQVPNYDIMLEELKEWRDND
jgi:dTDP-4-dehydrorhamnose reductase